MKIIDYHRCVLDASIVIKWFAKDQEVDRQKAKEFLKLSKNGKLAIIIPDLLLYEFGNALLKGKSLPLVEFQSALKDLFDLEIEIIPVSLSLLDKAYQIGIEYNLTVYDAVYVATAEIKNCPLITANPKCFSKVKKNFVFNLADLEF